MNWERSKLALVWKFLITDLTANFEQSILNFAIIFALLYHNITFGYSISGFSAHYYWILVFYIFCTLRILPELFSFSIVLFLFFILFLFYLLWLLQFVCPSLILFASMANCFFAFYTLYFVCSLCFVVFTLVTVYIKIIALLGKFYFLCLTLPYLLFIFSYIIYSFTYLF